MLSNVMARYHTAILWHRRRRNFLQVRDVLAKVRRGLYLADRDLRRSEEARERAEFEANFEEIPDAHWRILGQSSCFGER